MNNAPSSFDGLFDHTLKAYDPAALRIRTMATITANPKIIVEDIFFEGGDLIVGLSGSWRFQCWGQEPITLRANELLVIYPGNFVTIASLENESRLNYIVLNGTQVNAYFDSFGFYDGMCLAVHPQLASQRELHVIAEQAGENPAAISLLSDICRSWSAEFRRQGRFLFSEVIRLMNRNFRNGITRIKPLCDELKISRSSLERLFNDNGMPQPSAFIRRAQVRESIWQLLNSRTPIADIAQSVGIASPVYFTTFMKRQTGCTPSAIRKGKLCHQVND